MIRSILFAFAEDPYNSGAKNFAFWLSSKAGSHIHALSIIDIAAFEVAVMGSPDGFMPQVMTPPVKESRQLMKELNESAAAGLDAFSAQCSARGISISTEIKSGIPGELIGKSAAAHDILVVSRAGYDRFASQSDLLDSNIGQIIRNSVRPVLVAGREFDDDGEVRSIAVAYDGSKHAAQSLLVATELASRPGVNCRLINIAASQEEGEEVLAPAEAFLRHHGIVPTKQVVVHAKPSEVICDLASGKDVDLLIMGAYGRRAIREVLFGSTTEKVLAHSSVNVLLQS